MPLKALIAEDEAVLAEAIKKYLDGKDFDGERFAAIQIARNGAIALQLLRESYDVLILDLKMPEVDGTQVIEALDTMQLDKRPAVIIITAFPGAFELARMQVKMGAQAILQKPFELPQLLEVLREVVRTRFRLLELARRGARPKCQWTLGLHNGSASFVHVRGLLNYSEMFPPMAWINDEQLAINNQEETTNSLWATQDIQGQRRQHAKTCGKELYEKIFTGNVMKSFIEAGAAVLQSHDLKLTFVGPRDFLRLPLEFLNDGYDYLVLRHPMKRFVNGISSRKSINLPEFCERLWEKRERLRILLVAANTPPLIDAVDEEVQGLYDMLSQLPTHQYSIDFIPTEEASYDEVLRHLSGCHYHLLHYAGHGSHNTAYPGRSSLYLWAEKGNHRTIREVPIDTLKNMLRAKGHDLQFVYLSCCSGMETGDKKRLVDDDFLGIADGLILAGVPSVLGYRWPVSDNAAKRMAMAFYGSLFEQGNLSSALFCARCAVASEFGQDTSDWISPVLVAQGWG